MQLRTILSERGSPNYCSNSTTRWDAADFGGRPHFGFHGLEHHNMRRMRWTGPSAFILHTSPGASGSRLKIQLHQAGPTVREADLKIRVGSHRIKGDCSLDAWTLECSLPVILDEFPVIFVCGRTRTFPGDPRTLGCAVESELERMERDMFEESFERGLRRGSWRYTLDVKRRESEPLRRSDDEWEKAGKHKTREAFEAFWRSCIVLGRWQALSGHEEVRTESPVNDRLYAARE